jgi:pectin methylesterase-like acyl-CoA thioesterase
VADTVNNNDTTIVTRQSALAGTFTIGGASPDFADFTTAVSAVVQNGLCGPVVFNVRSGAYNEQLDLGSIAGSSAINTVTFQSESGNTPDVNLTFSATGTANNYVVNLSGASFVTFRNMTITARASSIAESVKVAMGCISMAAEPHPPKMTC